MGKTVNTRTFAWVLHQSKLYGRLVKRKQLLLNLCSEFSRSHVGSQLEEGSVVWWNQNWAWSGHFIGTICLTSLLSLLLKLETLKKENSKFQEDLNVSKEQLSTETQRTKSLCHEMWVYHQLWLKLVSQKSVRFKSEYYNGTITGLQYIKRHGLRGFFKPVGGLNALSEFLWF